MLEGKPKTEALNHVYTLVKKGVIAIDFNNKVPCSFASVIEAIKK